MLRSPVDGRGGLDYPRPAVVPGTRALLLGISSSDFDWTVTLDREQAIQAVSLADIDRISVSGPSSVFALDIDRLPRGEVERAVLGSAGRFASVILRVGAKTAGWARLMSVQEIASHCHISVRGVDDLRRELRDALDGRRSPNARAPILNQLAALCAGKPELAPMLAAAACLGARRMTAFELQATSGATVATLNRRLKRGGLVPAGALLDAILCVLAAYLVDPLGFSVQQAAARCGFGSRTAFDGFVKSHTGRTPATIARNHEFDELLAMLPRRIRRLAVRRHGTSWCSARDVLPDSV